MKNLRKFNESANTDTKVYTVVVCDVGGFVSEDECKSFTKLIHAIDYTIKYVNWCYPEAVQEYITMNTSGEDREEPYLDLFEPYFDTDGSKFFLEMDENPDYNNVIDMIENNNNLNVQIIEGYLNTKPIGEVK